MLGSLRSGRYKSAQKACASGFGNGGTPSAVKWSGCMDLSMSPTPGNPTPSPTLEIKNWKGLLVGWLTNGLDKNSDGKVNSLDWASNISIRI